MMNVSRRAMGALLGLGMLGKDLMAAESVYPTRPIRVLVPWPAGGLVDIAGRLVGDKMLDALTQPLIFENKPGAGGLIGADMLAKASPDGYTLGITTSALNMNAAMGSKLPFDVSRDFEPISLLVFTPLIVVVNAASGPKTLQELITQAKSNPGKLSYASAGNGTPAQFAAELLKSHLGLNILHVPYKGAPAAIIDQIAGRIDFQFANAPVALPQIKSGKLRALAITSPKRFPLLPDVPTMAEAGVPDFVADQWVGYLAPRGTPRAVVERISLEIHKAIAREDVRAALTRNGMVPATSQTAAEFAAYLKGDLERWTAVAKSANIKPD